MTHKNYFILFFYTPILEGVIMEQLIMTIVIDKIPLTIYDNMRYDDKIDYIYNLKEDEDALLKYEVENTIDILKENEPHRNIKDIRYEVKEYFEKDEKYHNTIIDKIYKNMNFKIREIYKNSKK